MKSVSKAARPSKAGTSGSASTLAATSPVTVGADLSASAPSPVPPRQSEKDDAMNETLSSATAATETVMRDAGKRAEAMAENYATRASDAARQAQDIAREAIENGKTAMEGLTETTRIAMQGAETLTREHVDYARKTFEDSSAAVRRLANVRSPSEFFDIHNELSRSAVDAFVQQSSRNAETLLKLMSDIAQPMQNRLATSMAKMQDLGRA